MTTKLAFMAWAASTESGLVKQVDQNRWIRIQMIKPPNGKMGNLKLPDIPTMDELRNKLIAASVVIGADARAMVDTLMARRPEKVDHRICQIYSVPAAVFATMVGLPIDSAVESFARMLKTFDSEGLERDQDSTLDVILTSKIRAGGVERSLLSLIEQTQNTHRGGSLENEELLASNGVRVIDGDITNKRVFMNPKVVSRELLRGSSLEGVKIDELILRIPGVTRSLQRINGKPMRGVMIPLKAILPDEQPPAADPFLLT